MWNLLEFPAGVIPIDLTIPSDCYYNSVFDDIFTDNAKNNILNSEGLPLCIQVVGHYGDDERVLGVMKVIEDMFPWRHFVKE